METQNSNDICTTDDYKMFKTLKGNRPLVMAKVDKIIASNNAGINLFPYCPVLVNEDHYVIDGQHRLAACRKMKSIVYYLVVPDFTLLQIATINSTMSKWKNSDYFRG